MSAPFRCSRATAGRSRFRPPRSAAFDPLTNPERFDLTETDESANQFWVRFATPFSLGDPHWLLRASLPLNSYPTPPNGRTETGLGDFNVFAAYLIDTGNPAISFGLGPQLTMPSATDDALGSGKWSVALANVLFNASSPKVQYGYLLTWQASFAGDRLRGPQSRCGNLPAPSKLPTIRIGQRV